MNDIVADNAENSNWTRMLGGGASEGTEAYGIDDVGTGESSRKRLSVEGSLAFKKGCGHTAEGVGPGRGSCC